MSSTSSGDKKQFIDRIIPIVLDGTNISDFEAQQAITAHWFRKWKSPKQFLKNCDNDLDALGDSWLEKYRYLKGFHQDIMDILNHISDCLIPCGLDFIHSQEFTELLNQLQEEHSNQSPS